jgi:hypothetical protein
MKRGVIAGTSLGLLCASLALSQAPAAVPPAPPVPPVPPTAAAPAAPVAPVAPSTTAKISFVTVPPSHATVTWGKKRLGQITPTAALVIVRPRDSGPLDVIVRAEGFLPVQTRAHTFGDARVSVKLTRPDEASTLLGYRIPIEPKLPEAPAGELAPLDPDQSPAWNLSKPAWDMTASPNASPVTPAPPPANAAPAR